MNFEKNSLNLPEKKLELADFDYEFKLPETSEEYLNRFIGSLRSESLRTDEISSVPGKISLKKKHNSFNLINCEENKAKSEKALNQVLAREIALGSRGEELNAIENQKNLLILKEKVSSSSRDASLSDEQFKSQDYYEKTNQHRDFFPRDFKKDSTPYAISLFGVGLENSAAAEKYFKLKLDNKNICLLGGGQSCQDLIDSQIVKPKSITNIDPYIAQEDIERSQGVNYNSSNLKADDPELVERLKERKIDKFDEIWASYSVPFYNKTRKEINNLFSNIKNLLAENGNCRITPLSVQEACTDEFRTEVEKIVNSGDFNIHLMNDTLVIHKLSDQGNINKLDDDRAKF